MVRFIQMKKPIIGVTAGEIRNYRYPWAALVHGQRHTFIDAVIRAGGAPIILPLSNDHEVIDRMSEQLDGLMLSGGNDIHPNTYGEEPYDDLFDLSILRDRVEGRLLDNAIKRNIPVIGICRGMQFINIHNGGTLYQDIVKDLPHALDHELSTKAKTEEHRAHHVHIEKDSKLYSLVGKDILDTNTHHHQAIKKLGDGLKIAAKSPDGIVEAIETDDDRFIIGVQGHPESLHQIEPTWEKLFKAFIEKSAGRL